MQVEFTKNGITVRAAGALVVSHTAKGVTVAESEPQPGEVAAYVKPETRGRKPKATQTAPAAPGASATMFTPGTDFANPPE
jgi:hypothetical protein